jgi:tetratricopeptide (TPR) repeat protein
MHDIKHLEEQWEKYTRKKRRPYYLLAIFFIVLLIGSYLLFQNNISFSSLIKTKPVSTILPAKHTMGTSPVWIVDDTLDEIERNIHQINMDTRPVPVIEDIPVLDEPKIEQKTTKQAVQKKPRKKVHIKIIETTAASAYKDVAKRFYQTHDPDDSLFLAKAYFKKQDYEKAEYWALQTNKVNQNIEESWLIFVQSKLKRGRKNEAIHILSSYVQRSHSLKAKQLLKKLKND